MTILPFFNGRLDLFYTTYYKVIVSCTAKKPKDICYIWMCKENMDNFMPLGTWEEK